MAKKKVLLCNVIRPYSEKNSKYNKEGDEEWLDYLSSRLTREPGPFTLSAYLSGTALTLMAANLDAEVTVLVHPSIEELCAELQRIQPDVVGISFLIKGLGKVFPMVAAARKHAPAAKVVIGGFGTMLQDLSDVGADYVCRGEGLSFLRNLIGQDPGDPVRQPLVTGDVTLKCFRDYPYLPRARYAELTHGFGCPHKCEFCTTSAFFGFLHIPFAVGRGMYDAMVEVHQQTGIEYFYLYEEDLCLYQKSLQEWGGLIRDDPHHNFSWTCFSTIKSLTRWDLEELVAMGFSHVWVGVESVASPFGKSVGRDAQNLFDELHDLGVTTTGSMIFGLDHHTPDNLHREVDHLISLYPSTAQMGTLMPAEGTELRRRLEAEGRVRKGSYLDSDLYSELILHPEFEPGELRQAVFRGYDAFYRGAGPAIHRLARTWLRGARRLKGSANAVLLRRGQLLAARARATRPILLDSLDYLPTDEVRETVRETLGWMREECGAPSAEEEARARLVRRLFELEKAREEALEKEPREPTLVKRCWIEGREVSAEPRVATAA